MKENEHSTATDSDPDDAPDLSRNGWPEKFAEAALTLTVEPASG